MGLLGADLKDRVAIVTGGSSGIGYGISMALAEHGCHVVPTSEPGTESKIEETVAAVKNLGVRTLGLAADVTNADQLDRFVERVLREFGAIDILVNCAGITIRRPSIEVPEEEWRAVLDVNLTGTFLCCQKVGKTMIARGKGSIVNIASLTSFVAYPEVAAYCASKGGVLMLTRALAVEWAPHGVRVNAIAPGDILTPLTRSITDKDPERRKSMEARIPMGRLGEVDEVAGAALYLCSDGARYITGHTIVVDGGHLAEGI